MGGSTLKFPFQFQCKFEILILVLILLVSTNSGADDLVPVISYVVIQSRLPQLVSECHAMSEFVHEGYVPLYCGFLYCEPMVG